MIGLARLGFPYLVALIAGLLAAHVAETTGEAIEDAGEGVDQIGDGALKISFAIIAAVIAFQLVSRK